MNLSNSHFYIGIYTSLSELHDTMKNRALRHGMSVAIRRERKSKAIKMFYRMIIRAILFVNSNTPKVCRSLGRLMVSVYTSGQCWWRNERDVAYSRSLSGLRDVILTSVQPGVWQYIDSEVWRQGSGGETAAYWNVFAIVFAACF